MKVVLVNKYISFGGAAIACKRLSKALKLSKIDVSLLVQVNPKNEIDVYSTTNSIFKNYIDLFRFAYERLIFSFKEKSKEVRFAFTIGNTGERIDNLDIVKSADIIHLHWINHGFLSNSSLKKLIDLNKPIVWTMHDMWNFTGGCHYSGECERYKNECGNCIFLKSPKANDLSSKGWEIKREIYKNANITFVACSQWLAGVARTSNLLNGFRVESIPNPIDTNVYAPISKAEAKKELNIDITKKQILFGAMNIADKRKGFEYLKSALELLSINNREIFNEVELMVFGKSTPELLAQFPFKVNNLGMLNSTEKIVLAYNAADIFVTPSLEDNLPNTIMEALSCGTPVAAFNTGGIPEMVDHKITGYLSEYKSAVDLAEGIKWILFESNYEALTKNARKKVEENYNEKVVAEKYIKLYNEVRIK